MTTPLAAATERPTTEYNKKPEPPFKLFLEPSNGLLLYKYRLNEAIALDLKITNPAAVRYAFKVKCSDNDLFRVKPPFGFLNRNETTVVRITMKTATVPVTFKHFLTVYHMKAKDMKKDFKQVWTNSKVNGVTRLLFEFKDADAKSEKKEEKSNSENEKDKEK